MSKTTIDITFLRNMLPPEAVKAVEDVCPPAKRTKIDAEMLAKALDLLSPTSTDAKRIQKLLGDIARRDAKIAAVEAGNQEVIAKLSAFERVQMGLDPSADAPSLSSKVGAGRQRAAWIEAIHQPPDAEVEVGPVYLGAFTSACGGRPFVSLDSTGSVLAAVFYVPGSLYSEVALWNLDSGERLPAPRPLVPVVCGIAVAEQGESVSLSHATGGRHADVYKYVHGKGQTWNAGLFDATWGGVDISTDETRVHVQQYGGAIVDVDIGSGRSIPTSDPSARPDPASVLALRDYCRRYREYEHWPSRMLDPDGRFVAAISDKGGICVFDVDGAAGTSVAELSLPWDEEASVTITSLSINRGVLAAGCSDGNVHAYRIPGLVAATGQPATEEGGAG